MFSHFFFGWTDLLVTLLPLLIAFILAYSRVVIFEQRGDKKNVKLKDELFQQLCKGFNGTIAFDESDLRLRYRKASSLFSSYVSFIEEFLVFLQNSDYEGIKDPEKVCSILKCIIAREQTSRPYEEIDENERRSLIAIENSIKDENVRALVKNDLEDLSISIQKKDKDLKRARKTNAWSVPLAIVSLAFTIVAFFWGNRLSKKNFDEMEKRISSAIERQYSGTAHSANTDVQLIQETNTN